MIPLNRCFLKHIARKCSLLITPLLLTTSAIAQSHGHHDTTLAPRNAMPDVGKTRITGIVRDTAGQTLPFVSIALLHTTTGTYTDVNGIFSMLANAHDTLLFSYTGFFDQRIAVNATDSVVVLTAKPMLKATFDDPVPRKQHHTPHSIQKISSQAIKKAKRI